MLKELFESIVKQAQESVLPERPVLCEPLCSADGRDVAIVYHGELRKETLPPPPRNHFAASAADLVAIVAAYEHNGKALAEPAEPVAPAAHADTKVVSTKRAAALSSATIFVGDGSAVAVLDVARRERVCLALKTSPHYRLLQTLPKSYSQKDAIGFLRRGFTGTGLDEYASQLRQVVFERQQVAAGNSQRNQESIGRSVEAKVTGTANLPEFLRGLITVYDPSVFAASYSIEVGCDPRLTEEIFEFWLAPDTLSLALLSAQQQLCEYLRESLPGATIVRGTE